MHCKRRPLLKQTDCKKRIIRIKIIDIADKIHLRIDSELDAVSAPDSGDRKLLKMFIVRDIGGKVKILSVMRQIKLRAQILRPVISRVVNGMNMVSAGDRNRFDLFPCIKGAVDPDSADSRNPDQFRHGELAGIRLVISLEVDCHLNRFSGRRQRHVHNFRPSPGKRECRPSLFPVAVKLHDAGIVIDKRSRPHIDFESVFRRRAEEKLGGDLFLDLQFPERRMELRVVVLPLYGAPHIIRMLGKHKFDLPVPDHRLDRIPHDIGHSELIRFKHYGGAEIRLEAPARTDGTPVIFAVNGNSHIFAERNFGAFPDIVNDTPDNVQCGDGGKRHMPPPDAHVVTLSFQPRIIGREPVKRFHADKFCLQVGTRQTVHLFLQIGRIRHFIEVDEISVFRNIDVGTFPVLRQDSFRVFITLRKILLRSCRRLSRPIQRGCG